MNEIEKELIDYNPNLKTLERNKQKLASIDNINKLLWDINEDEGLFPAVEGDITIQIGCSLINYGEQKPYKNIIFTLNTCNKITSIPNTTVIAVKDEKKLLMKFNKLILNEDPSIITGYNIDNFDTPWLMKRAKELNISYKFNKLSKFKDYVCELKQKSQKSAVGQLITVDFVNIPGRIQLSFEELVQKGYNLDSYKLDNVSAHFIKSKIKSIEKKSNGTLIHTINTNGLNVGNYVIFVEKKGYLEIKYKEGQKYEIKEIINNNTILIEEEIHLRLDSHECSWNLGKDDVSPKDIFKLQEEGPKERQIIAKYCMMDVILCIELLLN